MRKFIILSILYVVTLADKFTTNVAVSNNGMKAGDTSKVGYNYM